MGAENGMFTRDGEVSIGLTYMTGSLVRMGQKLAGALMGDNDRWGWIPYLFLWSGFVAGAVMAACVFGLEHVLVHADSHGVAVGLALDATAYRRLIPYQPAWGALALGALELGLTMALAIGLGLGAPLRPAIALFAGA